jgi:hypothetical protein
VIWAGTGTAGSIPFFLESERNNGELVETGDPKAARFLLAQRLRRRPAGRATPSNDRGYRASEVKTSTDLMAHLARR